MARKTRRRGRQNRSQQEPRVTHETVMAEYEAFLLEIATVVTPNEENGRSRFPEFGLHHEIRAKLELCVERVGDGNFSGALEILRDAKRHFTNKQVAYARGLKRDLREELAPYRELLDSKEFPEDLLRRAEKAVENFEQVVSQDYFELEDASRAYWAAIDVFDAIDGERQQREAKRKRKEREAREKRDEKAAEEARQREAERKAQEREEVAETASKMKGMLAGLN